jgi:hypothetical protein
MVSSGPLADFFNFSKDLQPKHLTWPHNIMGPRLYSCKELLEMILLYETAHSSELSLEDYNKEINKNINEIKQRLNNQYSQLARYKNDKIAKNLYNSYLKDVKKMNYRLNKEQLNLSINKKNMKKLVSEFPKLKKSYLVSQYLDMDIPTNAAPMPFKEWRVASISRLEQVVKTLKYEIKVRKTDRDRVNSRIKKSINKIYELRKC